MGRNDNGTAAKNKVTIKRDMGFGRLSPVPPSTSFRLLLKQLQNLRKRLRQLVADVVW